jgi:hypothetical protein
MVGKNKNKVLPGWARLGHYSIPQWYIALKNLESDPFGVDQAEKSSMRNDGERGERRRYGTYYGAVLVSIDVY